MNFEKVRPIEDRIAKNRKKLQAEKVGDANYNLLQPMNTISSFEYFG